MMHVNRPTNTCMSFLRSSHFSFSWQLVRMGTSVKRSREDEDSIGMTTRSVRANVTPAPDARPSSATASDNEPMTDDSESKASVVEDEREGDTWRIFLARKSMPFPAEIPLISPFPFEKFYVRKCYTEYYDYIMDLFHGEHCKRGVSVTGTPGIGKAVFMAYFLLSYRLLHPKATVVLASYSSSSRSRELSSGKTAAKWRFLSSTFAYWRRTIATT